MLQTNKHFQTINPIELKEETAICSLLKGFTQYNTSPPHPAQPALSTRQAAYNILRIFNRIYNYISAINGFALVLFILSSGDLIAQPGYNQPLPKIILEGTSGGNINGSVWNSQTLKDKINLILYVSPAQQESIENLLQNIDSLKFNSDQFAVSLILNTSATWIPNAIIETKVRTKAKEDSSKNYILDKDEILLNKWNLTDDNPNIILLNKQGMLVFLHSENITKEIIDRLLYKIKTGLNLKENLK